MPVDSFQLAYTVPHAARVLDVSRSFLYKLMAAGQLRYVLFGTERRIPFDEVQRLAKEGCPAVTPHVLV
ncbi:MAG: helix-turn-helix domain-containing protein [Pseudogulbenkiania sp.]|nr:helix-turn-helix domain-containing protein [Pseudogulbenkiania sp.]